MQIFSNYFDSYYIELFKNFLAKCYLIFIRRPLFRYYNKNNRTNIVHNFDFSKVKVGNYTYGDLCIDELFSNSKVTIGNYCSIASDVKFICGNHNYKHFSSYPFGSILGKNIKGRIKIAKNNVSDLEHTTKEIIIDDDVRIGTGAKIMSGVHIGQGAVIAAGAIVTKDIPPYAIAGGIPAKVIKYRFSQNKIQTLLQINYSSIPIEKFWGIYSETINEDFDISRILSSIN